MCHECVYSLRVGLELLYVFYVYVSYVRAVTTMQYTLWVHDKFPLGDNKAYSILFYSNNFKTELSGLDK